MKAGFATLLISGLFAACQGPDEYFWGPPDGGGFDLPPIAGHGGSVTGVAGTTGAGGGVTGLGGTVTGLAGTTGAAGTSGTAGSSAPGTAGTTGTAGSVGPTGAAGTTAGRGGTTGAAGTTAGRGGTTGAAGVAGTAGRGGTTGSAGTTGGGGTSTSRGGTTGTAGTTGAGGTTTSRGGTTGTAGTTGTGGGTGMVVFTDDFENESVGATSAAGWTRLGGSSGDWTIATDGTKVLEQNGASSSTLRTQHANGASGAPWSGATTASARVKLLGTGSSNQAALVCVRFMDASNRYCGALVPTGVQILTSVGGSAGGSAVFTSTVTTGTFYDLRISVDASNVLTVYLGGTLRGTYTPTAFSSGYVAVGTTSMTAAFDNISVTRP